ncbi:MAG: TonB-dependent receptor [Acidobacteria bacterium]|nr:TonB-dependent receptor [Acidobacteriota bacterium]
MVLSLGLLLAAATAAGASDFRLIDLRTGHPIAGADVSIVGRPGSAPTDAAGRFSWTPDPAPPFELLVVLPDGTLARPVYVERLEHVEDAELTLRVDAVVAEQITVSGAAPSIDAGPAAGMTSISGRDIAVRSPENLIQALENVAGGNQVSEGHAGVPALRGLSAGRTLILLDGARVTSERRVGPSATFLDPGVIEGVDVARGPGSVAYGSDAFGGVISARTRRVEAGAPLQARVLATVGAGIPEQRYSAELGRGFARTGVFLQAHARNAEDYDSPDGSVLNSGWQDQGFLIRSTHALGGSHVSLGWQSDFATDLERPRNNSSSVRFYYPTDDSHRFTSNYRLAEAGVFGRVDVDALLGRYVNVTDQDTLGTATRPRAVERADVTANDYQLRAVAERMLGRARVMAGLDIHGRFDLEAIDIVDTYDLAGTLASRTRSVSVDGADRRDSGVFVQADRALGPRMSASAGARVDHVTTTNPAGFFGDRSTANGAFSGFAAVTAVPFGGLSVTGQVSRGFRDPVLSDRYFRGPSGRGFVTGNPDLDPESSLQVDGAVRYTAGAARVGVNGYHYTISHLIERYGDGDDFFFRNRGEAVIRGLEAEAQVSLPGAVALEMTAQIARGETRGDEAPLDGITPATVTALARRLFGARGFAQARVAWFAEDDAPGPTEREVNGYTLVDVAAGVTVSRHVELRAQTRNLFDATYVAAQSTRAVLGPGRSATLTAVLSY